MSECMFRVVYADTGNEKELFSQLIIYSLGRFIGISFMYSRIGCFRRSLDCWAGCRFFRFRGLESRFRVRELKI